MNNFITFKRHILFIAFFFLSGLTLCAQNVHNIRKNLIIPNFSGYQTLKCDFHIHTVFSDGTIWPNERVNEAWLDGLDAIAITDHIEYRPHTDLLKADHNAAYEIAKIPSLIHDILLIKGTEITKNFPGHFNALFIQDANLIANDNYELSIKEAIKQGAYITLNHPRDAVQNGAEWWTKELNDLYNMGFINGIEIFNWNHYYPKALDFALSKKITITGNTDIHSGSGLYLSNLKMTHRPMTLVFVKDRSLSGIRDALDNQRTAVYFRDKVFGKEEFLKPLVHAAIVISKIKYLDENGNAYVSIINNSSLPIELIEKNNINQKENIFLKGNETAIVKVPLVSNSKSKVQKYLVNNFFTASDENLEIELLFEKEKIN